MITTNVQKTLQPTNTGAEHTCIISRGEMGLQSEMNTDHDWIDWIRTEANFGRIRTGSDCNFFENCRFRTGSD